MRQRFNGQDGKVVYIEVEPVVTNYPEGTMKVEVSIYPNGPGKYSSFIYTAVPVDEIEKKFEQIVEEFLTPGQNSYSSTEISNKISQYLKPVFPKR